jgi:hypothetical protein
VRSPDEVKKAWLKEFELHIELTIDTDGKRWFVADRLSGRQTPISEVVLFGNREEKATLQCPETLELAVIQAARGRLGSSTAAVSMQVACNADQFSGGIELNACVDRTQIIHSM